MALCTPSDMANLNKADLLMWYANNNAEFRRIGRREYVNLIAYASQANSPPHIVTPTPLEFANAVGIVLLVEQVFADAFKRPTRFNSWLKPSQRRAYAPPLARYMLDVDQQWIIY